MSTADNLGPLQLPKRIDYELTAEDYVAVNTHVALALPEHRRQIAQARAWGAVVFAVLSLFAGLVLLDSGAVASLLLAGFMAIGWWVLSPRMIVRDIRRRLARVSATTGLGVTGPASVTLDENGLREECGGVVNSAPWSAIQRVEETTDHAFVFVGPLAAVIIPQGAVGARDFVAAVRQRIEHPAAPIRVTPARTSVGDRATPNLASRDFAATSAFYARLGFVEQYRDDGWMILARGQVVLEFFPFPDLDPATSAFSSCLRLDDVDSFVQVCVEAGVPVGEQGWPRLHLPKREASGLRIGALLDPDANLLRLIANP